MVEICKGAGGEAREWKCGRLTADFVASQAKPGKYLDGLNGLQLCIQPTGSRSWVQRVSIQGRKREIGLGGWPLVSLEEAREKALANRKVARAGLDPTLKSAPELVFEDAFERMLALLEPGWKNGGKSARQWRQSMETYAYPRLRRMPVAVIEPADIVCVLAPIWYSKEETARRVRQRIHRVLQWSRAHGYATGPNPVDAAVTTLPRKPATRQHFPAVPHHEVSDALAQVFRSSASQVVKLSLGFLVLTAARGGEVRLAEWDEVDPEARIWVIPDSHTKTGREHKVPLSTAAMRLLEPIRRPAGLVFPAVNGMPLSDSTHSKLMRDLGISGVPHGFRSSFRDWAAEVACAPREVAELSLGHIFYGKAEMSYARSDLLDRRRPLMQAWSDYAMPQELFGDICASELVSGGGPGETGGVAVNNIDRQERIAHPAADGGFQDRMVRIGEVCEIAGLSRSAIHKMARAGSFPPARRLSANAIGWRLSEVMDWMDSLATVS